MSSVDLQLVRNFERRLDSALHALPSASEGGEKAISLSAKIIEEAYAQRAYGITEQLRMGLKVLAPSFIRNRNSEEPEVERLIHDLMFAAHYFCLRDYLYYTYNAPGTIAWRFGKSAVEIAFRDRTIPRQYYLLANNNFVVSMERFADFESGEEVIAYLRNNEPAKGQSIDAGILSTLKAEIELKLGAYFNFLSGEPVDFGDYLFTEFEAVFKVLLIYAVVSSLPRKVARPARSNIFQSRRTLEEPCDRHRITRREM
jgi:hypothetical protein